MRVSTVSGVVISGGISVAIFGLAVWAVAEVKAIVAKVSTAAGSLRFFRFACFMGIGRLPVRVPDNQRDRVALDLKAGIL